MTLAPVFGEIIYQDDFNDSNPILWNEVPESAGGFVPQPLAREVEGNGNSYLASTGPWLLDGNHAPPGAGYLNLLAFGSTNDLVGSVPVSFRDATFNFRIQAAADFVIPAEASIFFLVPILRSGYRALRELSLFRTGLR